MDDIDCPRAKYTAPARHRDTGPDGYGTKEVERLKRVTVGDVATDFVQGRYA